MKKRRGKFLFVIAVVITTAIVTYIVLNVVFSPYWNSVYPPSGYLSLISMSTAESADIIYTKKEATEDLDYIVKCLERVHPLYNHGISSDVKECLENEKNSFGERVTSYELWHSAARLLNSTGDSQNMTAPSFPRNYLTDYLKKTHSGYVLEKINGMTVDEIFQQNNDLFSYELEAWGKYALENCFQTLEGLKFIGFDSDSFEYTYINEKGIEEAVVYSGDDFHDYETSAEILGRETDDTPLYSSNVIKDKNVAVLTLDSCVYDEDSRTFLYDFIEETTNSNISNIVVDLRNNSGGTSQIADEFLSYLNHDSFRTPGGEWRLGPYIMRWDSSDEQISHYDEMRFDGDVYILTSVKTFSSATLFAEIIQDNGFGKIAGEPCGNMPDGYGDIVVFQTPNAVLSFQISSKHYERIDTSKSDLPLIPDIECNADDALDEVMSIIEQKQSPQE